jgi:hypothetical protein
MLVDWDTRGPRWLSYCTNVHAGESVDQVLDDLEKHAIPLKARLSPHEGFALGLRLSERAVTALDEDEDAWSAFHGFLKESGFVAYTLNVFPQGAFQTGPLKADVYEPDWQDPRRYRYTLAAARVLARLLEPEHTFGTLSTLPLGYGDKTPGGAVFDVTARRLTSLASDLARLEEQTGKRLLVCLEPEPLCLLETTTELVTWYRDHLMPAAASLESIQGRSGEELVRRHIGVCYDACHQAVEYEDPAYGLEQFHRAGIEVGKIQVSCALELRRPRDNSEGLARLRAFAEPHFLHQVVARNPKFGLQRFLDLGDFLQWFDECSDPLESVRCHFHVPIHLPSLFPLHTTRDHLDQVLARERVRRSVRHLEVETYTFRLLPGDLHAESRLVDDLESELRYAHAGLTGEG